MKNNLNVYEIVFKAQSILSQEGYITAMYTRPDLKLLSEKEKACVITTKISELQDLEKSLCASYMKGDIDESKWRELRKHLQIIYKSSRRLNNR